VANYETGWVKAKFERSGEEGGAKRAQRAVPKASRAVNSRI